MLNILRIESIRNAGLKATLAALMLAGSAASMAANVSLELCATAGSATMPGTGEIVSVLGYSAGACAAPVTAPGGPILEVTAGDTVTVTLHNNLAEATGLAFQGQELVPDLVGIPAGGDNSLAPYSFTPNVPGTYLYQAAPLVDAQHLTAHSEQQTAMGLYGALIVRPSGVAAPYSRAAAGVTTTSGSLVVTDPAAALADVGASVSGPGIAAGTTVASVNVGMDMTLSVAANANGTGVALLIYKPSQAYAAAGTAFDVERTLVLSEIDPALTVASAASFDMREFAPKYFLINGKAYPDTAPIPSAAGLKLLLRYVNAGTKHHSMATLGLRQAFIAKDGGDKNGNVLPTADVAVAAETLAPGQTGDALIAMPVALAAASKFPVYDANLKLHNSSDQGIGGMLTFVTAGAGAATAGPAASGATVTPNPANGAADVTLAATITSTATGGVTAAGYFTDAQCTNTAGTPMAGTFGSSAVAVSATISAATLTGLTSGNHTFYVHGQDSVGWGACTSVVLNLDRTGPTTSALTLTPNPIDGTVALAASASDVATGGSNVVAADYTIFAGTTTTVERGPFPMTVGGAAAPVRGLTATIAAGLSAGTHTVSIVSRDALGNPGTPATITLTVAAGGPATSFPVPSLLPSSANNGNYGISSGQPVVRVLATETADAAATVTAAEGFIDTFASVAACNAGTSRGFPFVPVDGVWGGAPTPNVDRVSADIPLATIARLSTNPAQHTIYVRGKDSAGAWGNCAATPLLIDKVAPSLASTSGTISPTIVAFGGAVTLTFSATDNAGGSGIAGVAYWFDATNPPANPRVASATHTTGNGYTATLNLAGLGGGTHTVFFKARDAANNLSANTGKTANNALTVVQARPDNYFLFLQNNNNATNPANSRTQTVSVNAGNGVLSNDVPGTGTRSAAPGSPVVTKTGGGSATMSVSLNTTTGAFSYTLTVPNTVTGNANIRAAKRGTYTFQYTFTRNGISTPGTVTIRVL